MVSIISAFYCEAFNVINIQEFLFGTVKAPLAQAQGSKVFFFPYAYAYSCVCAATGGNKKPLRNTTSTRIKKKQSLWRKFPSHCVVFREILSK